MVGSHYIFSDDDDARVVTILASTKFAGSA